MITEQLNVELETAFKKAIQETVQEVPAKSNTVEDFRDLLHNTCISYYSEERVYTYIESNLVHQIIHFPEIVVDNGQLKTTVYDLFFKLKFSYSQQKLLEKSAAKFTYTHEQYGSNYMHSHISGSPGKFSSSVCFGSDTVINEYCMRLFTNFDIIEYDLFLGLLDSWLKYESLSGGPYVRIETIRPPSTNTYSKVYFVSNFPVESSIINKWASYLFINKFSIKLKEESYFEDLILVIDEDYIENLLDSLDTPKVLFNPDLDLYYAAGSNTAAIEQRFASGFSSRQLKFKDKIFVSKLISSIGADQSTKKVHPYLVREIIKILKKILNAKQQKARISFT